MKALLVGIGGFGAGWYRRIRSQFPEIQLAVVDVDEGKRMAVESDQVPFYISLSEAIERERPDFLINVTPRYLHKEIDHLAFDHKLPVFSEKPIAGTYQDAIELVDRAKRECIPFMIAENYRAFPFIRKLKQLIDEGAIGTIHTIDGHFYRFREQAFDDKTELLEELVVHHFDLLRYLTGREVGKLFASFRRSLFLWMEMQAGIIATFHCSIESKGSHTDWAGHWRIEGSRGCLELVNNKITLTSEGETIHFDQFDDVVAPSPLREFLNSLNENREPETSARDYLRNQALAHYARESIHTQQTLDTSGSWGYGPMIIRNFYEAEARESVSHHGKGFTLGTKLFSAVDFDTPIEFLGYTEIPPGSSVGYHGHREDEEVYIILEGTGMMTVNGQTSQVKKGDVILNKPWWKHGLENDSSEPLRVLIFEVKKTEKVGHTS